MTHLWVRAEQRANETRVGLTPKGAAKLVEAGFRVTIEESSERCIPSGEYASKGAEIAPMGTWPQAPDDAIIFGLKELPQDGTPLHHRHIMFGHTFKGQPAGIELLTRFKAGGGALFDLEYLVDVAGTRVAAFGYWAGYAGAAVALKCWAAQQRSDACDPLAPYDSSTRLLTEMQTELLALGTHRPTAIVIGALGRVGRGASDFCTAMGVGVTRWDLNETAHGGPFPEILAHDIFLNCILARPGTPVFVPAKAVHRPRKLSVIGDIACDPESDFSPIKVYDRVTTWDTPALRVHDTLDVTAIDNLPALLPRESSEDFSGQLLPSLLTLNEPDGGVWARARATFEEHLERLP